MATSVKLLLALIFSLGTAAVSIGQISQGGTPYSVKMGLPDNVASVIMAPVDAAALRAKDAAEQATARSTGRPVPPRFGFPLDVDFGLNSAGTWTDLSNGDRLWLMEFISTG